MYQNIKNIFKSSLLYSLNGIMAKVMGLILIPFYTNTKFLTTDEYGVMGLIEALIAISPTILILGINWGFYRFYWDKDYKERQKQLLFNNIIVVLFTAIISLSIIFLFRNELSAFLFAGTQYGQLLVLITVIAFFNIINGYVIQLLKLNEKALFYTFTNAVFFIAQIVLTLVNLIHFQKGIWGIYEAQLIALVLQFAIYLPIIIRNIKIQFDLSIIKDMLSYSLPMAISSLSSMVFTLADKYTLRFMSDLPDVGYYSLGFRLSNTFKIIISTSVLSALVPILYKKMHTKEGYELHYKSFRYLTITGACLAVAFILLRKEIVSIFVTDNAYLVSSVIIPFIVTGIFIALLKDIIVEGLKIEKKTFTIGFITVALSLVNIVLNIAFVKLAIIINAPAITGTAVATLITQMLFLILVYRFSRKVFPVKYDIKLLIYTLFYILLFIGLGEIANSWHWLTAAAYHTVLVIMFPLTLYLSKIIGKQETEGIMMLFKDFKNRIKN